MIQLVKESKTLNIELHQYGYTICPADWGEVDNPTFHRVYYIQSGSAWVEISGKKTAFEKGCLYVMPVNTSYSLSHDKADPLECTYFHLHTLPLISSGITKVEVDNESTLGMSLSIFRHLVEKGYHGNTITYEAGIIVDLLSEYVSLEIDENPVITETLTIIREKYGDKLSNNYLAEHFGYNSNYFIKLFCEHVGITPGAYIKKYRLGKSIEFILQGKPISVIAGDVGYDDPKAFSRFFKKQTGVAPSEYVKYYKLNI